MQPHSTNVSIAATRTELHLWRIRCAIGTHEMLDVVRDRGPLEALVDEVEADSPELAAEALVELSQSYWVEWRMKQATQCARLVTVHAVVEAPPTSLPQAFPGIIRRTVADEPDAVAV